ncbi:MAG: tripartite tricarboxylate transporter substrate binding protein [Betaproteobacteria bacterium]|nr:tripartite tricarboxylate transporter substrate binding protein [Betaproteobacteria bacterium]
MKLTYRRMTWMAVLIAALVSVSAAAQTYPAKPIRMVIAFGGGAEAVARILAQKMSEGLGEPVVVDPQPAASGTVGAGIVARSAPDGYTIFFTATTSHLYPILLRKSVPFDPIKDFTPISGMAETVGVVAVPTSSSIKSIKDLVEAARASPDAVHYGSSGHGSVLHLAGMLVQSAAGVKMIHVSYRDSGQALNEAIAGRIPVVFSIMATAGPMAAAGKVRIIAVNYSKRFHRVPDIPTISEELPGYETPPDWSAFFGPAGLPQPIVRRLNAEIVKAVNHPDVLPRLDIAGAIPIAGTPEELAARLARDMARATQIVKAAGIEPE